MQKAIYILMLLFSFSSTISRGARNSSFALLFLLFLYSFFREKNRFISVKKCFSKMKFFYSCYFIFFITIIINILIHGEFDYTHKNFIQVYYRIFIMIFMVGYFKLSKKHIYHILVSFLFGGLFECLYSIYQSVVLNINRTNGFLDVMQLALLINFVLIFSIIYFLYDKKNIKLKVFYLISFIISVVALILNRSRGAWLSIVLTLAAVFLIKNLKDFLKYVFLIFVISLGVLIGPDNFVKSRLISVTSKNNMSNTTRINFFKGGLKMYKDYPIFGIGYGNFKEYYHKPEYEVGKIDRASTSNTHNNFIRIASEAGTVGIVGYLAIVFGTFYSLLVRFREEKDNNPFFLTGLGVFFAYTFQGLTENNLLSSDLIWFYWLLIALCLYYPKNHSSVEVI